MNGADLLRRGDWLCRVQYRVKESCLIEAMFAIIKFISFFILIFALVIDVVVETKMEKIFVMV